MTAFSHIRFGFDVEPRSQNIGAFEQVHGSTIHSVRDAAHWNEMQKTRPQGDGACTFSAHTTLSAFSADCLGVLLFSEEPAGPIAAIHSGWRGAMHQITRNALDTGWGTKWTPHAVFSPCLMPCCFEVRDDFVAFFSKSRPEVRQHLEQRGAKLFFDLPSYVRNTSLGDLPDSHVDLSQLRCTYCSTPALPSFRRNRSTDPRIRSWIEKIT